VPNHVANADWFAIPSEEREKLDGEILSSDKPKKKKKKKPEKFNHDTACRDKVCFRDGLRIPTHAPLPPSVCFEEHSVKCRLP
jgi:hypothetical protein